MIHVYSVILHRTSYYSKKNMLLNPDNYENDFRRMCSTMSRVEIVNLVHIIFDHRRLKVFHMLKMNI